MGQAVVKDAEVVRVGILGVARISSRSIIEPASKLSNVSIVGIASRSLDKAREFAEKHSIPKFYGSYEALLEDESIDAVYIPLPNGLHCEWSIKALQHGKHVLCEKPLASNAHEVEMMIEESKRSNRILVEASHYQHHPLMKRILDSGEIGRIKHINTKFFLASYLSGLVSESKEGDIRFQYSLAGGTMMDLGPYPMSLIRILMQKEPEITSAKAVLIKPNVDATMEANMKFENGSTASLYCSFRDPGWSPTNCFFDIEGEKGSISCFNFVLPHVYHTLSITVNGHKRKEKIYGSGQSTYFYQLDAFVREIQGGPISPTTAEQGLCTMRAIDAIYHKAGMLKRGERIDEAKTNTPNDD